MKIDGVTTTSIRLTQDDPFVVEVLDQRMLPHRVVWEQLTSSDAVVNAISEMHVRGAPLIGATAAWGVYLAVQEALAFEGAQALEFLARACERLAQARPTAVNLSWAVDRVRREVAGKPRQQWLRCAERAARAVMAQDVAQCRQIGEHGLSLIRELADRKRGARVNLLTHCNAGWLACVEYGTATSPIYQAHDAGIDLHVWVDETRPRNQGAKLTAWELGQHGVPHTLITDNAGGHLMQHGMVDLCLVGSDRVTRQGDVANKIGTYLKALAAHDNGVPFYAAFPSTTVDWSLRDGVEEVPIELRDEGEVTHVDGLSGSEISRVRIAPASTRAANYGFDVTPARLLSGLISERGVCAASEAGLLSLYPEHARD